MATKHAQCAVAAAAGGSQQQQQRRRSAKGTQATRELDAGLIFSDKFDAAAHPARTSSNNNNNNNSARTNFWQSTRAGSNAQHLFDARRHSNSQTSSSGSIASFNSSTAKTSLQKQLQQQRFEATTSANTTSMHPHQLKQQQKQHHCPLSHGVTTQSTRQTGELSQVARAMTASGHERGLAATNDERKRHNMLGLLPVAELSQDVQAAAIVQYIDKCTDDLAKYVYLRHVKDFNERLFYYTLMANVEKLMPIVYTPIVGLACQRFSDIFMQPRGLYVSLKDLGCVAQRIQNWPGKDVRVIVMTDGERILGLGDLGAQGMGISIGKLSLYTSLAGIPPENVMPVCIDVGTNNQALLDLPHYIGLKQQRQRGAKYEALIEEFMKATVARWGRSCLIQFEDFGNSTAFDLLARYRNQYCTFNDDIQGTASVSLSGLITAARSCAKRLGDCTYLFYGAGEANLGTAALLVMAICDESGTSAEEARERCIWLVDSKGLVVSTRKDLSEHKRVFARNNVEHIEQLEQIIDFVKPNAIVGASAQGGAFNEQICNKMATYNVKPIIFALSNPTSKAECTAQQAYDWTRGTCIFASGSPFDPVVYDGKTYITGQGNNAYIFPGVGLAAIGAHTHLIPEETFLVAARALSDQVTQQDLAVGLSYPRLSSIRQVTLQVAARVLEHFYNERLATYRPEPSDKLEFLKSIQYDPRY